MHVAFSRWYQVIEKRRSRRHFDINRPIEAEKLSARDTVCREFVPFPGARSCLGTGPLKAVLKGVVGSYEIKGAPTFIAFIGEYCNEDFTP
jgi:hypothetical protein